MNKYLILNLMVTLQWDHNFCCIIVDFEPLGTNEQHFVKKLFFYQMGEIIPFPVWIVPFPVLKINFENFGTNKKYVVKEVFSSEAWKWEK